MARSYSDPHSKTWKRSKEPSQLSTDSTHELPLVRLGGTLSAPFTQAEGVSLYVDDLQISCEGSDMRIIERQLQTAVNNIVKWCDSNGHSISASKSCCVHFCRKRGIHPDPDIRIRDVQIPVVPDVRFLGVIFDRRLTFLPHILHLRKRCEKSL
ncbi:putative RNA-directed DNA polymerase from transposon X-element [Trichonephila clavipes]|nr:putative RNA-directed DNA polymerase from transposon X-element [Trichonephila clavipes]